MLDSWNGLWVNRFTAALSQWQGWRFAGGILAGKPAIGIAPNGVAYIACRDAWNAIWINSFTYSTGFSGWQNLHGVFYTDPSMTVTGDGLVHIVSRDTPGAFGQTWIGTYTPGTGFGGWRNSGGVGMGAPFVTGGANDAAYITLRDAGGYVWLARAAQTGFTWFYGGQHVDSDPLATQTNGVVTVGALVGSTVWTGTFFEGPDAWQEWEYNGGSLVNLAVAANGTATTMAGRDASGQLWWHQSGTTWTPYSGATFSGGPVVGAPTAARKSNIVVMLDTLVSQSATNTYHYQPGAASGLNWISAWMELVFPVPPSPQNPSNIPTPHTYLSNWSGTSWSGKFELKAPGNRLLVNPHTVWDHTRNRYIAVAQDQPFQTSINIWFAFSDINGGSWQFRSVPAMSALPYQWDLPTIAVNGLGHIAVGATAIQNGARAGYFTVVSMDGGVTFSSVPYRVDLLSDGLRNRIVGTDDKFHVFSPVASANLVPVNVARYESTAYNAQGISWSGPMNLFATNFAEPAAYSGDICDFNKCGKVWYSPYLEASGYRNGLWAVAFPVRYESRNRIYIHTSDRGGGIANNSGPDQFLAGVSVSADRGYWLSYWTMASTSPSPSVNRQTIYFPPSEAGYGVDAVVGVKPHKWVWQPAGIAPCPLATGTGCFESGDYHGVASNPYAGASTPFVSDAIGFGTTALLQQFLQDPPAPIQPRNFRPEFVPIVFGTDLRVSGGELPPRATQIGRPYSSIRIRLEPQSAQPVPVANQ